MKTNPTRRKWAVVVFDPQDKYMERPEIIGPFLSRTAADAWVDRHGDYRRDHLVRVLMMVKP